MKRTTKPSLYILMIFFCFSFKNAVAQKPDITYASPQTYVTGITIAPLIPTNQGGAVPANIYKQVSTFAGSGASLSGNGIGTNASFNLPSGIGLDANSNIYICDFGSGAIRKITPAGVVTTIGNATDPTGLTADDTGNVFVSSSWDKVIYRITPAGVKTVFASGFSNPGGLNFDGVGNLYVADQGSNQIKMITPSGVLTVIAGTGQASAIDGNVNVATFYRPDGVAVDNQFNIYVADAGNNKIRKITPAGVVSTFAGSGLPGSVDGNGTNARLYYPTGITIDPNNNLYVADYRNYQVRKITPNGDVTTLAGGGNIGNTNGVGKGASFNSPIMLAFDKLGNLFVTDFNNNLIRKISLTGYTIDRNLPNGLVFDARTGIISGTPTETWTKTDYVITAYNLFGSDSETVNIEVVSASKIVFNELPTANICQADFDPEAISGMPITYSSSNLQVATILAGKIHVVAPGITTITATNGTETSTRNFVVSDFQKPFAVITADATKACQGVRITFRAIVTSAGTNPSFNWFFNGINVNNNASTFSTVDAKDGDLVTCQIINTDYCVPVISDISNEIRLSIEEYTTPTVEINASTTEPICAGFPITFVATGTSNSIISPTYEWLVNDKTTGINESTFTSATLKNNDVVTVKMQTENACTTNPIAYSNPITVAIRNDCEVLVRNSFTPNGDGVNDYWQINAVSDNALVKVFNRNGSIVYQSTGYKKPWDGNLNGRSLPVGTYYYLIISEKGTKKDSGSVTILR
ncbi:gliding motility-associated C-terminal domain-containing protein [Pedobacter fastidiosus]|uniref:Gliding motility-associated C-terminal domain-containing protein n=1 Tax=Pedobacter fastidiosus TaxID=2765361 RepID=A0ABR7KM63_9SPHI|nr:gliding motility-associated C-terminal domain-containing protein [Pedobacter fastidiosus]MBC6108965.1 gliding motility-associated C-terminal domain-containing protein [Pedobacter fastidiosus]